MRPYSLKTIEIFIKYLTMGIFLIQVPLRRLFTIKQKFLRAHSNTLHNANQCINTFHMSYQQPLYALFLPDPDPDPDLDPRDPPYWHYIGAP